MPEQTAEEIAAKAEADRIAADGTWHTKLPEDIRADASLTDFKDETEMVSMPVNVARSFISTKKLVGRDKIPMPKSDEEWNETYKRLGRPEAASMYNIDTSGIENAKLKGMMDGEKEWFSKIAHDAGLNESQASKLFAAYGARSGEMLKSNETSIEQQLHDSEVELRTAFGNNFEGKLILMNRGLQELDDRVGAKGSLLEMIKDMELSRDPKFVKAMVLVGEMMSEDMGLDKTTGDQLLSPELLDDQISAIQQDKAYTDASEPGHKVAVQKLAKLMQIKHGKKPVETMTRQSFIS